MLKELSAIKGMHTELVSVYVPAGYNLNEVVGQLKGEEGTASNIKSKSTRKNVVDALEKIVQHLRTFRKTPENGLVVFAGNVSQTEGKTDLRLWSFEPFEKMNNKIYWCDQVFVLDPLKDMIEEKDVYGLVVMDSKEAYIGLLKGKKMEVARHIGSMVPGKTTKGGWSQSRYEHVREMLLNDFMKKIGEEVSKVFLEQPNIKGIIIGGPGPNKEEFYKGDYMNYMVKQKVLGVKDTSYTDETGLEEIVQRSQDLMKQATVTKEKELMSKFLTELAKNGNVVYGLENVKKALNLGAVDMLLLYENLELQHVKLICSSGHEAVRDIVEFDIKFQKCDTCGSPMKAESMEDISESLSEKAKEFGAKVEYISSDTPEGNQFKQLGGIGAMLRYKLK
ncbi:peptide chain release factor 1 [archaeon]|nr:MAG: peptide chain release factor 1 [archaeon]